MRRWFMLTMAAVHYFTGMVWMVNDHPGDGVACMLAACVVLLADWRMSQ